MKSKYTFLLIVPILIGLSSCGKPKEKVFLPGPELTLTSIEMKAYYGDATLIQFGNYDILIDTGTGSDANHVKEVLNTKVSDLTLEMVIFTHPHGDHIGGVINNCLNGFKIETIVDYGYNFVTEENGTIENSTYVSNYTLWRDSLASKGTKYYAITDAIKEIPTVTISKEDDCYLKWLKNDYYVAKNQNFPNSAVPTDNPNTTSVSCYVQYKYWNIVLCGDIDSSFAEMSIVNNHQNLFKEKDRVILKAAHHASSSSMGSAFLDWANPELIYVSAAMVDGACIPNQVSLGSGDNEQNHPNKSTVRRMVNRTDKLYWNAINGDLTIKIDGVNDATVSGSGRHKNYYTVGGAEAPIEEEKNVTLQNSEFYKHFTKR